MLKINLGCEGNSEFGQYAHRYRMSFHRVTFYPADGGSGEIVFNGSATENWSRNAEIAIRQHDAKMRGNNPAAAALGSIKQSIITALNAGADPVDFGFDCRADDGQGNEYWCKNQGATIVRLNCYTDPETDKKYWDDNVSGWENHQ
jgi:hypothetical protein